MNKKVISIEGNIGVGKSTFTNILKNHFDCNIVSEPVDIWMNIKDENGDSILGLFYKDINRWAYSFQNFAYITRMTKINEAINSNKELIFLDRSLGTDKNIFEKMLYDDKIITNIEHNMYQYWHDFYKKNIYSKDEYIIYLKCSPKTAFERIKKRGREEEKNISFEYLEKLHKYHEEWLLSKDNVLVIDCDKEFENDNNYQLEIINNITNFINNMNDNKKN